MARGNNQKLKLLYMAKILQEKTDENHRMTVTEIKNELEKYDIASERKSIYTDFEALRDFGLDIIKEKEGTKCYYYIGSREMEVAELKLLVDVVQSSKFLTEKKSKELIKKLENLVSQYEAKQLNRQVYVHGRVKTMNESIYYNVDKIQNAIGKNVQIRFQYYQWNVKKEMELRHDGAFYMISPWEMIWDNENYYLVGYDEKKKMIKHFRVDKMIKISLTEKKRSGKEKFEKLDMALYSNKRFSMYDGKEDMVQMEFENHFAGVVLDRFGKDIMMHPIDEKHFRVSVKVAVSNQFFGWIMGLGTGAKIVAPQNVVQLMREEVRALGNLYP